MTVRRFHDCNMSGWWVVFFWLFALIPVVGWIAGIIHFIILACMDGTPGPNQYGPNPKEMIPRPYTAGPLPEAKPGKADIESRLAKAKELFERGILTEEEYNRKRAAIISEI